VNPQIESAPASCPLAQRFEQVRAQSLRLAEPLSAEDCQAQSMPDASPVKWHLAHVTWFFETFVLEVFEPQFKPHNPAFRVLFNSYYNAVGNKHPRAQRGLLTRPSLVEVLDWRQAVDARVLHLLATPPSQANVSQKMSQIADLIELGLQHEQQHQELLLTDVKHLLFCNGLRPVYRKSWPLAQVAPVALRWLEFAGGVVQIGQDLADHTSPGKRFAFDNETPRHLQHLRPYALANRLVTHGEWLEFMQDGAYSDARWWLSAGWDWVNTHHVDAPLYWTQHTAGDASADWHSFSLHGEAPIDPHTPITHISYFEADAFARWKAATDPLCRGARLPTEFEWEAAAAPQEAALRSAGNFIESNALHPMPVARTPRDAADGQTSPLLQALGDVWEWTSSSYQAYPGFAPWAGAVGEYNGKFMVNQYVLRGGSCATPRDHIRASYRNFFPTDTRWQFSGLRLARSA
jgi:ergothioneine biosynthesis protein EgtB